MTKSYSVSKVVTNSPYINQLPIAWFLMPHTLARSKNLLHCFIYQNI